MLDSIAYKLAALTKSVRTPPQYEYIVKHLN